jgi:hypothetical protein
MPDFASGYGSFHNHPHIGLTITRVDQGNSAFVDIRIAVLVPADKNGRLHHIAVIKPKKAAVLVVLTNCFHLHF